MENGRLERKDRYREEILEHINNNPDLFLALDTPSERRGRPAKVSLRRPVVSGGRIGPRSMPNDADQAFGAGFYDGVTFGFGDELDAGLSAVGAMFDDREMGDVYDSELVQTRARVERFQSQHPLAFGAGMVVGSLAQPLNYTGAGWAARGVGSAARIGRAAAAGGLFGGVDGFAHGEGGLANRAAAAGEGALAGAVTGAVIVGGPEGYIQGPEFKFGNNFRIAPFGNRTPEWYGQFPHYHRRGPQLPNGHTVENQGIGRHRPWQSVKGKSEKWLKRF